MLTIVGWLWRDKHCRNQYFPEHANAWARAIHRNLTLPHRFVLLTDKPKWKFDPLIEKIPLWDDWRNVRSEAWREEFPQCLVRLKAFSRDMRAILGDRFVSIDLDCSVVGNLDAILGRTEDFLICLRPLPRRSVNIYQARMWMMNAGARENVWLDFKGAKSLRKIAQEFAPEVARHYLATDQGWLLYKLGRHEAGWKANDGVYFWPWLKETGRDQDLPKNARIVFFPGMEKPWMAESTPYWMSHRTANEQPSEI